MVACRLRIILFGAGSGIEEQSKIRRNYSSNLHICPSSSLEPHKNAIGRLKRHYENDPSLSSGYGPREYEMEEKVGTRLIHRQR